MPSDVADPHLTCPECGTSLSRGRKEQVSTNEWIKRAMRALPPSRLSLLAALVKVLDPSQQDFAIHQGELYESSEKIHELLNIIFGDSVGSASLLAWMKPRSADHICRKVYNEMDKLKGSRSSRSLQTFSLRGTLVQRLALRWRTTRQYSAKFCLVPARPLVHVRRIL